MVTRQLLIGLASMVFCAVVSADDTAPGNVHPRIRLSFTERFRMVSWDNAVSLDESAEGGNSFTRHRTNVMGQWYPTDKMELALKLTNEFRNYFVPEQRVFTWDEVFVDQFYFKYRNEWGAKGTLTVGRQNITLGEGFVVMDGHPLDGSRSIYFNAVRYDWKIDPRKQLTMFYCYQDETDEALPIIHDQETRLLDQPEEGIGAYFDGDLGKVNLEGYYIRKNMKAGQWRKAGSEINTLGARVRVPVRSDLSGTAEGAYQFGDREDFDHSAYGGYAYADYNTGWGRYFPQSFRAGAILLSGDDPATDDSEGWDPLFGRWPKWSESYIYTLVPESGVAYWSNFASLHAGMRFAPAEDIGFKLDYHHLMAPQESVEGGNTRGELLIGRLDFRLTESLTGHVVWEHFEPGDFYADSADPYNWLRTELLLNIH